jgi:P pilus assembly chaperone PapD
MTLRWDGSVSGRGFIFLALLASLLVGSVATAGLSVYPRAVFLSNSQRSVGLRLTNDGSDEREVWVESKYGYLTSDEKGDPFVVIDSIALDERSAAQWIRVFPQRFILGPDSTQTVKVFASPQAGAVDGEYWARIVISSKRTNPPVPAKARGQGGVGIVMISQISLPFHYRVGTTSTGLEVSQLRVFPSRDTLTVGMFLKRTGNASFWGTASLRLIDRLGKVVRSAQYKSVVYRAFSPRYKIDRRGIPSGEYRLEVELYAGRRVDVPREFEFEMAPVVASIQITLP